jgi:lactoylglutathione lyase
VHYRNAFPIIYTADVERAARFYRDALGFAETFRFPADGDAAFASFSLDGSSGIALSGPGTSLHGLPITPGARGFELCVYTDDVDAAVSDLRGRGYAVLLDPVDQPWGERMAYVADPDGNPVMICAVLDAGQEAQ